MKKVLLFAAIASVVSLSSCKKDYTCSYEAFGFTYEVDCLKCSKADVEAIEASGLYSCEKK